MEGKVTIFRSEEVGWEKCKSYYEKLHRKGIYHSPDYIRFLADYYKDPAEIFVYGDEENFVYYPYFRRNLKSLPYSQSTSTDLSKYCDIVSSWYYGGPLVHIECGQTFPSDSLVEGFLDRFRQYAKKEGIVSEFIRFDPNLENHREFIPYLSVKYKWETVYVDLECSEEDIWAGYAGRCRTAIRKARKYPISIKKVSPQEFLAFFPKIYFKEMERKKARSHYLFTDRFFVDLISVLKDRAVFFLIQYEENVVGGTICLFSDGIAYDYLTASLPEYWKYQINNLLFHEVISWCKNNGAKRYDFHGGRDSVYFFKAAFSKQRAKFYVAEVIHIEDIYDWLVSLKRKYRNSLEDNFFPQYRIKDTN